MKYYVLAVEDGYKDDILSNYLMAGSGRYLDDNEKQLEIHRIGYKGALSEDMAKTLRVDLGKMILEGKCRTWNKMKVDMGVLK